MDDVMHSPQGSFALRRGHDPGKEPLRAWDAADEYALAHLHDEAVTGSRWLVANDAFGALSVALAAAGHAPQSWSDSVIAHQTTVANLERNGLRPDTVTAVPSTSTPAGPIDVAVVKVPRTLALLDDQLRALRGLLHPGSVVIGAGMTKSVHTSTIETFERHIGTTPTTRARKKARLLLPVFDASLPDRPTPDPVTWTTDDGLVVANLPNTFSRQSLDRGTRMLLSTLPMLAAGRVALDLGCGNGVVAATLGIRNPGIRVVCVDESYQAVESARITLGGTDIDASFHVTDVLDGIDGPVDLVLCNPPFHAGGARTTAVADRMFAESARVLSDDGQLRVVANRHLPYHATLKRHFDSVVVKGDDPKFVVLACTGPRR